MKNNYKNNSIEATLLTKSAVLYGTIRDIEEDFLSSFINLELISKLFKNVYFIILENDSTDNTRSMLLNWSKDSKNKRIILKDNLDQYFPLRATRLAYCRNEILNFMKANNFGDKYDYAIHCDLDNRFWSLNKNSLLTCFEDDSLEWDMMSAVSKNRKYYDFWALRCEQSWFNINIFSCENQGVEYETKVGSFENLLKNTEQLIPVLSSFNGLAIYKTKSLLSSSYDATYRCNVCNNINRGCWEDNDHIGLHRKMIHQGAKLFINNKIEIISREENYKSYQYFLDTINIPDLGKNILTYLLYTNSLLCDKNSLVIGNNLILESNSISKYLLNTNKNVYYMTEKNNQNNKFLNSNIILIDKISKIPNEILNLILIDESNYENTNIILESLKKYIDGGTIILFKNFINFEHYIKESIKSFYEFVQIYNINFEWIGSNSFHGEQCHVAVKIISIENNKEDYFKIEFDSDEYINFDWVKYTNFYSDLAHVSNKEQAFSHWQLYGKLEGRIHFPFMDSNIKEHYSQNNDGSLQENTLDLNNNSNEDYLDFDWELYLELNKDLLDNEINTKEKALFHWENHGKYENRKYKFDWCLYINHFNLLSRGINDKRKAIDHWISNDYPEYIEEDLDESLFDWKYYVSNNEDLKHINNVNDAKFHWNNFGKKEGRKCHNFNWTEYLFNNPYLVDEGIDNEMKVTKYWIDYNKTE